MSDAMVEVGSQSLSHKFKYSIGTLVTDLDQYGDCVRSFQAAGFGDDDCEFLYIDNTGENAHSAFDGLNRILNQAGGEFVILCHQDVVIDFDRRRDLDRCLSELEVLDKSWAVVGNAGGMKAGELAIRITDPHGDGQNSHEFPQRVFSLDENFIVLRRSARLAFSADLAGFHFYGADICLIADVLGYRCYVIDFHLRHLSGGNKSPSFYASRTALAEKYARAFRPRLVQTSCALVYLTGSPVGGRVGWLVAKSAGLVVRLLKACRRKLRRLMPSLRAGNLNQREA